MFTKTKKRVNIFIRLLEGAEIKVPCLALHIQNDIFEIIKNNSLDMGDKSSIWEFFPGDLVRCDKSNGAFFAKELISSTFADRNIYQLIFLVVKSGGEANLEELKEYKNEIRELCTRTDILQREHPIVVNWRMNNCK